VDHGVAFAQAIPSVRPDGSRVDYAVRPWPIEHVRWDSFSRSFKTQVEGLAEEEIVHGDGKWIVFAKNELDPFKHGTLLAAALVWARHAFAVRDWAKGSVAHGSAKFVGELPEGVPLQDASGLTAEANAFLELLKAMGASDSPVGIRPAGSTTDFVVNTSTAWQVWAELVNGAEKAAARIYLGTDGVLGAAGGAPGVDIQALFGVASTIVDGDLEALSRGLKTGVIDVWCAVNFGDSSLAPERRYKLPDPDADARFESEKSRRLGFLEVLEKAKSAGVTVDADELARAFRVPAVLAAPTSPPHDPVPAHVETERALLAVVSELADERAATAELRSGLGRLVMRVDEKEGRVDRLEDQVRTERARIDAAASQAASAEAAALDAEAACREAKKFASETDLTVQAYGNVLRDHDTKIAREQIKRAELEGAHAEHGSKIDRLERRTIELSHHQAADNEVLARTSLVAQESKREIRLLESKLLALVPARPKTKARKKRATGSNPPPAPAATE
jgi:hypothetical protein